MGSTSTRRSPAWSLCVQAAPSWLGSSRRCERSDKRTPAYHLAVMGVGVAVALFAGIDALQGIFEDLLDGDASARTFLLRRGELATVATVVPILWLHQIARRQVTPAPQPAMAT